MATNKRLSRIKGTKDFLVVAVVAAFLCLWSIRDAWFPTEKILKKHPLSFPVTVSVSGVVQTVPVKVGDEVSGASPLLTLSTHTFKEAVDAAEAAYKAAKEETPNDLQEEMDALVQARADLKATTVACSDFTLETTHGDESLHGVVLEIFAAPATEVEAGDVVMRVRPNDTFYAFNKTLAVISFIGFFVALIFHHLASKK